MGTLLQDLRYGARMLRRNPGFAAIAIVSLALGIGAASTVFSLVDTLLFRPAGARDDDQIVRLYTKTLSRAYGGFSYPDYVDLQRQNKVFSGITVIDRHGFAVVENGRHVVVLGQNVSPSYFDVVGVQPAIGRGFLPGEDAAGSPDVVVLSHGYWQRRFGGDPAVIGKTVAINNRPATIVGIAPRDFQGTEMVGGEMWLAAKNDGARLARYLEVLARLRPGVSPNQAQAEMDTLVKALGEAFPDKNKIVGASVVSESLTLKKRIMGSVPLVLVGFVLLIACATVENLLLARAEARRHEIALRQALGATRIRLLRQLLTEGMILSLIAGAFGLLLTEWLIRFLPSLLPAYGFQLPYDFRIGARVLMFAIGATALTVLVFGLAPALESLRQDLLPALQGEEGGALLGFRGLSGRKLLVIGQVAISLVLIVGAGLLTRSLLKLNRVDLGFEKKPLLLMMVANPGRSAAQAMAFQDELLARATAIPGVRRATCTSRVPLSGSGGGATQSVYLEGAIRPSGDETVPVRFSVVGADYFPIMGTRVLRGRYFEATDTRQSQGVVLVNQTMAGRFWPSQDPLGKHFRTGGRDGKDWEVIGVTQDGKYLRVADPPEPYIYFPLSQMFRSEVTLVVETSVDPASISDVLMRQVRAMNRDLWALDAVTLKEHVRSAMWEQNALARLIGGFGGMALLLTCVGLYGVVTYAVSRRTREIGVRMALGATRAGVLRQVLSQGLVLSLIGTAIGWAGAAGLTRFLSSVLYGISPFDPLVFAASPLLMIGVTLLATFIPARKAMRVDPQLALRHQ
jgi:predicted permease